MSGQTFTVTALVLKRTSVGEKDRLVTLLSKEHGRFNVIAKGARSILSSRLGLLEPGALIKAHCVARSNWPILTQAIAIDQTGATITSLSQIKSLTQLLELLDKLFVEEEVSPSIYQQILDLRKLVVTRPRARSAIQIKLVQLLADLGFIDMNQRLEGSVTQFVSNLTNRKLLSFPYLTVNPNSGVE